MVQGFFCGKKRGTYRGVEMLTGKAVKNYSAKAGKGAPEPQKKTPFCKQGLWQV